MVGALEGGEGGVGRRLAMGRKISEFVSKSHNARLRLKAYDCFIKLVLADQAGFASVWKYRMAVPRKRREAQEFLENLRGSGPAAKTESARRALTLLWLLEELGVIKRSEPCERDTPE